MVGDVKVNLQSVNAGSFLTIQPSAGEEYCIINILVENGNGAEIYFTDGVNSSLIDSRTTSWLGYAFNITNGYYLKIKNTAATAKLLGYSGIQIK